MTTLNEVREAVYSRFTSNYTGVTSDRIYFENEDAQEPATGNWVRVAVRNFSRNQSSLGKAGNRRFLGVGSVFVQVYVPTNTGVQTADALAREALILFEGVSFSGLRFHDAEVRETGPDGRWYQMVMEANFDYQEVR